MEKIKALREAEDKAMQLLAEIENRNLLQAGKTEKELNKEIHNLALEMFDIKKYWHKRIVRAGKNTLHPYHINPPNLTLRENEILFLDLGPVFENWEADVGKTYVIGNDPHMQKLKQDVESAWHKGKAFYDSKDDISAKELYEYVINLAGEYGWEFGNEFAGHHIGKFPHQRIHPDKVQNYIHADSDLNMKAATINGDFPFWILEIHFVDPEKEIGGFFEQLLN